MTKRNSMIAATLLAGYAMLGLSGCGGGLQGAEAALQERRSARAQSVAALGQIEAAAKARIVRNPFAFGALVLIGDAAAKDFAGDREVGEVILGGAYCLFNAEECGNLAADLLDLSARRGKLVADVQLLDNEIARLTARR